MEAVHMGTDLPDNIQNVTISADMDVLSYNWIFLFLIPLILVTAVGNILVCVVVVHIPKLQTANNLFLMSLAVADLMVAVLVMPLGLVKDFYGVWPNHPSICSIWITLDVFCCTASILHISVISLDRYLAVCDPIRFSQKQRKTSSMVCKISLVWITSAALSSPLLILGLARQPGIIDYGRCTIESFHFKLYGSAVAFFLPLLLVVVTYLLTTFTLRSKSRLLTKMTAQNSKRTDDRSGNEGESWVSLTDVGVGHYEKDKPLVVEKSRWVHQRVNGRWMRRKRQTMLSNEAKANQVLLLVFVVFVSAWTPFFVVNIFFAFCTSCPGGEAPFVVLTWVGWASSMVNPIIYTTFNSDFRLAFWKILSCNCSRGCGIRSSLSMSQMYSSTALGDRYYL